jgi:hypothetical protein
MLDVLILIHFAAAIVARFFQRLAYSAVDQLFVLVNLASWEAPAVAE